MNTAAAVLVPLAEQAAIAFASDGPLARSDPHLAQREVQQRLAHAVALAIEQRGALVAEAGTGVGKTFAYLVPLLLSGRRALVSTATKNLQDQLFLRDLPGLCTALGLPVTLALLKGRSSYLCLQRLQQARQSAELPDRWAVRTLARVEGWAQSTRSGDLAELEGLDDRSPVIPLVTSTRDNCLGSECPQYKACHVMQARRDAMAADLVVVNHHLFFADMALRDSGVAELLPTVDVAVFDEAHQLVEAGVQFLGRTLGTAQLLDLARDLLAVGLQQARGLQDWHGLSAALEQAARELRLLCAGPLRELRGVIKLRWQERAGGAGWVPGLQALAEAAQAVAQALQLTLEIGPDFDKLAQRALALVTLVERFGDGHARRPCALDRRVAAAGAAGRIPAGHPRDAHRATARRGAHLDLHLGHARRRRGAELVHLGHRPGGCDHAARRQPLRLSGARPAVGADVLSQAQRLRPTRPRWACWRQLARARWAGAASC